MERLSERYEVSLVGHRGAMQDLVFKILAENVTIGRHPNNDIVLEDPMVSGQHARIVYDGMSFEILDLDSRSGVRVNTKPMKQGEIRDGDRIRLGSSLFIFSVKSRGGKAEDPASKPSLMGQRATLDAAAKARLGVYGMIIMVLGVLIVLLLGAKGPETGLRGGDSLSARIDIGPLAVEQFSVTEHQADPKQVQQASLHLRRGVIEMDSGNLIGAIEQLKLARQNNPDCLACKEHLDWAFTQLRKKIAYHYDAGDDDFKNLRYRDAVRHWEVARKLVQPSDPLWAKLERLVAQAQQKQAELDRRAVGLP